MLILRVMQFQDYLRRKLRRGKTPPQRECEDRKKSDIASGIRFPKARLRGLSACVLCLAIGCNGPKADYSQVDLVKATGTVTLDGRPLVGAVVQFEDVADQTFSYGTTDENGKYKLQFDSEMEGVKTGEKIVRITLAKNILGANVQASEEGEDPDAKPTRKEPIPAKFNRNSILKCSVGRTTKQFDFNLTSNESE